MFDEGQAKRPQRLTSGRRAMIFVVGLLHRLLDQPEETLSVAASEAYYATLQKYHGWIVTGTFTVALKIVPSRCVQRVSLMGSGPLTDHGETMRQQQLCGLLGDSPHKLSTESSFGHAHEQAYDCLDHSRAATDTGLSTASSLGTLS